jgi:hypothetical protein
MTSKDSGGDAREPDAASYRRAAEETLEQLDWCVNYLYRIRKTQIADVLGKNRSAIRRQLNTPDDRDRHR